MGGQIDILESEIKRLRRLVYLLKDETFKEIYESLSHEQRIVPDKYIMTRDFRSLKCWFESKKLQNYRFCDVLTLRKYAKNKGVMNWHVLSKESLIHELEQRSIR